MGSHNTQAEIGIIGGSGFYELLDNPEQLTVDTPYGAPSDQIAVGEISGVRVAFLPRHGKNHSVPPAEVNYRANVWALKSIGVKQIIATNAVGSLKLDIHPGDFVICDQVVDRTHSRQDTYFTKDSGKPVTHISFAEPFCPELRAALLKSAQELGYTVHNGGVVVTIQGPRFSTKAESEWFSSLGWSCVNMTQYPEVYLARELEMCYACLSLVTDYDAGLGVHAAVTSTEAMASLNANINKQKEVVKRVVSYLPTAQKCECPTATGGASF